MSDQTLDDRVMEIESEWYDHERLSGQVVAVNAIAKALATAEAESNRRYTAAAAALALLSETRPYVFNVACEHRSDWRGQTAAEIQERVDAVLATRDADT